MRFEAVVLIARRQAGFCLVVLEMVVEREILCGRREDVGLNPKSMEKNIIIKDVMAE